jgi:hypothetical protein
MLPEKREPAAWRADRLPNGFAVAAESIRENSRTPPNFQAARCFGTVDFESDAVAAAWGVKLARDVATFAARRHSRRRR